jgi:sugar phosphate isomerase/epimerase
VVKGLKIRGDIRMIRVGVTTGLYYIARAEELATSLKKIGYALTRGTDAIEISGDTPHEINYSLGKEIRDLAKKQGIDLCFHGSLTTPFEIPERSDWRDAQDHVYKSIRSAVFAGCKYVLFHASLHYWLEMITYTTSKLDIVMCDFDGNFISEILYKDARLRRWFGEKMWEYERQYVMQILRHEEIQEAEGRAYSEVSLWREKEFRRRVDEIIAKNPEIINDKEKLKEVEENIIKDIGAEAAKMQGRLSKQYLTEMAIKKMANPDPNKRKWKIENYGKLLDAYDIMIHYLFFNKDPIWLAMVEVYKDVIDRYKIDYNDDFWLDRAWKTAQETNDRAFKQFWYAVVGAKYLEGHLKDALNFINGPLIKELKQYPDADELIKIAKNLKITIEIPDAREPKYAGQYILWHPKQLYAAIKTIRKTLKTDKIFITIDWEHLAGHGIDPLIEIDVLKKIAPDFGKYVLSVHSNSPNPLHAHYPLELGDLEIYKLSWFLRETGFGKQNFDVYLWFERGGGDDPFRQSVEVLKLCAKFLEKDVPPDELPEEYFGIKLTGMDYWRQRAIMLEHRFEPLKDLLEMPEEEWGMLSSVATRKGKTKEFKKEEMR